MYPRLMLTSQVLLLLLVVESSWAVMCGPCPDVVSCPEIQCPGQKVMQLCSCCPECAKQKGEICGGLFNKIGICDRGLECVRSGHKFNSAGVCE
ncbi:hypothetical protein NFI96_005669, partial [Prochilodus magdalenae]